MNFTDMSSINQARGEALLKQREEEAAAEKERALQLIQQKDAEAEAFRVAALQRENEMRENVLSMMVWSHAFVLRPRH